MRPLILLFAFSWTIALYGQPFEGRIKYNMTYKSNFPNVTDEQLTSLMGSSQDYFIKNGNYKALFNGLFLSWQLYTNSNNKLYTKLSNSDSIFWVDGSNNLDTVVSVEINKGVTEVLGYKCDEIIIRSKAVTQKHYFSSLFPVDLALFSQLKYNNWFEFLSRSKSLSLKSIVEGDRYTMELNAVEIKPMHLEPDIFKLPEHAKLKQQFF
jgi:hypothetical protein